MKKLMLTLLLVFIMAFTVACGNDNTPAENNAENNTTENNTDEGATSGLSNLVVVEKISAEWATAGHSDTGNPLNYAGGRDGCQPCHSGNGFSQFLTDAQFTPEADAEAAGEDGEPAEIQAQIGCATCHTGMGKDLIDSGIAKAELVPFSSEDFDAPGSALCLSCHNGRRDVASLYEEAVAGEIPTDYPHYDSGALFSGQGGMEYPDVEYANSAAHQSGGCANCHMPETEDGYASHEFGMNVANVEVSCVTCHADATDFTVGGDLKARIDAKLAELETLLLAEVEGAAEVGLHHGEFPFLDADGELVPVENVSVEAFVGAYNYAMMATDKSGGAHNPQYAISLLDESIKALQ